MKDNDKSKSNDNRKKKGTNSKGIVRVLSVLLCGLLIFSTFVGFLYYAKSEEAAMLRSELDGALSEIEVLKERNAAAQEEIDGLNADNAARGEKIGALEESNSAAQEEIDSLKQSIDFASQEIDSLKQDLDSANRKIDSLKASNDEAKSEIDELEKNYAAAREENSSLKGINDALGKELEELKSEGAAAREEIEQLKAQIKELELANIEKIKIYIDQGHNPTAYHNSGAIGNGLYEQDITYTIGILLAEMLEDDGRFEVCLSRPTADTVLGTDNNSSLDARIRGAEAFGADYFISLHTNSYSNSSVDGIEVYTVEQGGASYALGSCLLEGLLQSTKLRDRGMKTSSDIWVLRKVTMPAVLLELGFISNKGDAELLLSSPLLFAKGIYNGIISYLSGNVD